MRKNPYNVKLSILFLTAADDAIGIIMGLDIGLSPERILSKLWDCEEIFIDNNTLTVYIRRLRTKIEDNPGEPQKIVTVRRMGYRWNTAD